LVIHLVTIDVTTPGLSVVVTPPDPIDGHMLRAKTTTAFMKESGCQVAMNGSYFMLLKHGWGREFPMRGDPLDVLGLAASRGITYSPSLAHYETLFISKTNQLSLKTPIGGIYNAISGGEILVEAGRNVSHDPRAPNAISAAGLSEDRSKLILLVIDGKQPGYSEGASLAEAADILIKHGAADAVLFDGGGSSALSVARPGESPTLLNTPMNLGIVGLERPVGNHLGIAIGP
jgi:hypothetical protein